MARKSKIPAERRDEILDRIQQQRSGLRRLEDQITRESDNLKEMKEEAKGRNTQILKLIDELEMPEQICKSCGQIRKILEELWPDHHECPECKHRARLEAQRAAAAKKDGGG